MTGDLRLPLAVTVATLLITWVARVWAEQALDHGEPVHLFGDLFRLTLGENAGVAFGLLGGSPLVPWLAALALVLFALCLARPLRGSRVGGAALGLILGGGLANLLDRLGDRGVTDYLDVGLGSWRWPTFNLPDVAITVGAVLVAWAFLRDDGPEGEKEPSGGRGTAAARRVGEDRA
ncbi:signal peptidase II (plasmid) [Rubrobacter tropicus]|uniref:Lipoprotein signal peptidase n=1 Tax=Rubrobacter tropicus TaxID=2653851 RepID=A0A6G8QG42_9ACTN|nr:signal peptidase II [Rubrobacter tropicus]QIN85422.1 signal peptidase II [Rubrobacter tropicus]